MLNDVCYYFLLLFLISKILKQIKHFWGEFTLGFSKLECFEVAYISYQSDFAKLAVFEYILVG